MDKGMLVFSAGDWNESASIFSRFIIFLRNMDQNKKKHFSYAL